MQKLLHGLDHYLACDQYQWILWIPVAMGIGISIYFSLPFEPSIIAPIFCLILSSIFLIIWRSHGALFVRFSLLGLFFLSIGFSAAFFSTHRHETPLLQEELGPVTLHGRLVQLDVLPRETRFILDRLEARGPKAPKLPELQKVRISWRGSITSLDAFAVGETVKVRAVLLPPKPPAFVGAYDFRRHAFFDGLSATGYALKEPIKAQKSESLLVLEEQNLILLRTRSNLTLQIRSLLKGDPGGLAAALVTGDRSGITPETREHFARSGVAHVLAISGLHLSLIAGIFFFLIRRILSLVPSLALHFPLKKIAALVAWISTLFYLILCNFAVPASRAFVMISLFFAGVLLDRLAVSMRSVAFAASVILLIKPEALIHPSFQLSFAAVTALIAFYEKSSTSPLIPLLQRRYKSKLLAYCVGLVVSSLIATIATTPYIASFFHSITLQSITGNMVAVPMLGFLIMPLLVLFLLSLPFGGSTLIAKALAFCLEVLQSYISWVSSLRGAAIPVPMISPFAIGLLTFSLLWMILWKSRWRYYGLMGCVASLIWMVETPQPDIFIDAKRRLIAIKDPLHKTIVVNTLQSARFAREVFKEASGAEKVERVPSKEGYYTYGGLEIQRHHHMLEVRQGDSTLTWHFMDKDLVRATFNGKKIDLEATASQGILLFWKGNDISLLGFKNDAPKRPWQ